MALPGCPATQPSLPAEGQPDSGDQPRAPTGSLVRGLPSWGGRPTARHPRATQGTGLGGQACLGMLFNPPRHQHLLSTTCVHDYLRLKLRGQALAKAAWGVGGGTGWAPVSPTPTLLAPAADGRPWASRPAPSAAPPVCRSIFWACAARRPSRARVSLTPGTSHPACLSQHGNLCFPPKVKERCPGGGISGLAADRQPRAERRGRAEVGRGVALCLAPHPRTARPRQAVGSRPPGRRDNGASQEWALRGQGGGGGRGRAGSLPRRWHSFLETLQNTTVASFCGRALLASLKCRAAAPRRWLRS